MKLDHEHTSARFTTYLLNEKTKEFAIVAPDGIIQTYYVVDEVELGMSALEYFKKVISTRP